MCDKIDYFKAAVVALRAFVVNASGVIEELKSSNVRTEVKSRFENLDAVDAEFENFFLLDHESKSVLLTLGDTIPPKKIDIPFLYGVAADPLDAFLPGAIRSVKDCEEILKAMYVILEVYRMQKELGND